jgi:hypothetical protein
LALSTCAVVACGSTQPHAAAGARVFTGTVAGTDAQVALVASTRHVRIYFCGGPSSYMTLTQWFTLELDSSGATHGQPDGATDWTLDGQVADPMASGNITLPDGTSLTFQATRVSDATIAGLYEAAAGCGKIGLIVMQASSQSPSSGQGACVNANARPSVEQVNPIKPLTRGADGSIPVQVAGSTDTVSVRAAAPL